MFHRVYEKSMHRIRWFTTVGWVLLTLSLFYDPFTIHWTDPNNLASPFHLHPEIFLNLERCVKIRESCIAERPFAMGTLFWWSMIVPSGILILFVLGHETWRRICPLSFLSQIPRALGIQRKKRVLDPVTGEMRLDVPVAPLWLQRNFLYVQFGLFCLGLAARLLFVNGHRLALGIFLVLTMLSAIFVGYLYAGKSWCHYFCPMAPVQLVYSSPRSVLGSQAHLDKNPITQSMCRTVNEQGAEQSACVRCKAPCFDIDAEQSYWTELELPGRRLMHYGYLGMIFAFYGYFFLYSGNWNYYFTGSWAHEEDLLTKVFDIGFYIGGHAIPIPKFFAVFITFAVAIAISYTLGRILEKIVRKVVVNQQGNPITAEETQHISFTIFTLLSFWSFFSFGARPMLNRLPPFMVLTFNALVVAVGAIWVVRTLNHPREQYEREKLSTSLRRQLRKIPIPASYLNGRSLDDLSIDEVYTLSKVLPELSMQEKLKAYTGVLQDLLEQEATDPVGAFQYCASVRQGLQLKDDDHYLALQEIGRTRPELLAPPVGVSRSSATTVARTVAAYRGQTTVAIHPPTRATRERR